MLGVLLALATSALVYSICARNANYGLPLPRFAGAETEATIIAAWIFLLWLAHEAPVLSVFERASYLIFLPAAATWFVCWLAKRRRPTNDRPGEEA